MHPPSLPSSSSRGVIITRPEPGLGETASAIARAGWEPVLAPALHVQACAVGHLPRRPAALLLTSGQAVGVAAKNVSLSVPVFAVGDRTAQKARAAGFVTVCSAGGNAQALVRLVVGNGTPEQGTLLLFSGAGQGVDLAASLRNHGFSVVRRVAYRAEGVVEFPASVVQALQMERIAAILFFSARSAQSWLNAVPDGRILAQVMALRAVVMSDVVAQALHQAGWRGPVMVAASPDAPAMLAALEALRT
ncbi:uroporphyrinogen-III synthase [Acetobacter lambici]|uniref:Uroporphyrinogen-III synthase n=1 Tax=Acetobacter lambici TaxID=1332824 RepID=A0ABT1F0S5_9PROT|nr:uroporphyrinogen-III synthase [Acetobacter lambici]MCP1241998.1 uroporphyrinogen-III synthase [Acetobacter lambici]MCP1257384.1 uroporphyrinogen-III synthase [Acetobacter lambici]NHO56474.1 uroporphyrinogen-III synthase [Acetobacter lambici]